MIALERIDYFEHRRGIADPMMSIAAATAAKTTDSQITIMLMMTAMTPTNRLLLQLQ